jgi:hypothetical protein
VFSSRNGLKVSGEVGIIEVHYDDCPPSLNRVHSRHWSAFRKEKQRWQRIWAGVLLLEGLPRPLETVFANASMRFPVRRPRDEGNFRWMLEKALGDALVEGRWLVDDTQERFSTGAVIFESEPGPHRTTLRLTYERSEDEVHPRGPQGPA